MKNWTIARRISLGFAAALLITAAIGAGSYSRLRAISFHTDALFSDSLPGINLITRVQANARESYALTEKILLTRDEAQLSRIMDQAKAITDENSRLYRDYEATIHTKEDRAQFGIVVGVRAAFNKTVEAVVALSREGKKDAAFAAFTESTDAAFQRYDAALQQLVDLNRNQSTVDRDQIVSAISVSTRLIVVGLLAAIALSLGVALLINRGVNRTLRTAAGALDAGAEQVAAAANQVSTSSQSLAEGASHQAASIEETSATLEEVSSMSKKNAEHATQAKSIARETRSAADQGAKEMAAMKTAMDQIKAASNDISRIIKSIDEIAFQTNILALNAAVEAARAGEAGLGFAVVADEVRNLAQRSAQSARETAAQIAVAIEKSDNGVVITGRVAAALDQIVERTRKMDDIVADIATASNEQSQGVAQVNQAVGQMDRVTQANAGTAEETAAAAEELNAQSLTMRQAIAELRTLVGGAKNAPSGRRKQSPENIVERTSQSHAASNGSAHSPTTATPPRLHLPNGHAARHNGSGLDLQFADMPSR